jgi:hypothetical protein
MAEKVSLAKTWEKSVQKCQFPPCHPLFVGQFLRGHFRVAPFFAAFCKPKFICTPKSTAAAAGGALPVGISPGELVIVVHTNFVWPTTSCPTVAPRFPLGSAYFKSNLGLFFSFSEFGWKIKFWANVFPSKNASPKGQ